MAGRTAGTACGPTETNRNLLKRIPYESYQENFERNLVFLKGLRDGLLEDGTLEQLDLTALGLPAGEREAFLQEVKTAFQSEAIDGEIPNMLRDYFHSQLNETQVDNLMGLFNNQGKLIQAHDCMKKGNPYQTVLARTLVAITRDERTRRYSFDAEKSQCHSISYEKNVRSRTIRDLCIQLVRKGTAESTVRMPVVERKNKSVNYYDIFEAVETYKTMFIELNEFRYSANYISFKSEGFFETNFVHDSIIEKPRNVFNIHPKLAYLFYKFQNEVWMRSFFEGRHVCPQIPADKDISRFITTPGEMNSFRTRNITFKKNNARVQSTKTFVDIEKLNNAVTAMYYGACFRVSLGLPDPYTFYSMNFREKVETIASKDFSDEDIAYIEEMSLWTGSPLSFPKFKFIIVDLLSVSGGNQKTRKASYKVRKSRRHRTRSR